MSITGELAYDSSSRTALRRGRVETGFSRLDTNFRPQNYGAVGKTLLATTMMAECYDFSMGSTFRAIGQSQMRNALLSEIRRDCGRELLALSIGLSNAHFKSLGLPSLIEAR
jgi:hypothetical protein